METTKEVEITPDEVEGPAKEAEVPAEDAETRIKLLQNLLENAEKRGAEERRQREEAEKRGAEERRQREEAEKREDEERRQREEAEKREDEERRQREEAEKRGDEERRQREEAEKREDEERRQKEDLQRQQRPTQLLEYLSLVEEHLFTSLEVEKDPNKAATRGTTDVGGRRYPSHFQPWTDFLKSHTDVFKLLTEIFGDKATFPSRFAMRSLGENQSPKVSDEMDLRPFLRNAVEKPASSIVTQFLQLTENPTLRAFRFSNNSYGVVLRELGCDLPPVPPMDDAAGTSTAPTRSAGRSASSKRQMTRVPSLTTELGNPDRWGYSVHRSEAEVNTPVLVGEYKAAHNLHASKLQKVMSQPPRDDFFIVAAGVDAVNIDTDTDTDTNIDTSSSSNTETDAAALATTSATSSTKKGVKTGARLGNVFVARVLCQAYHYMVTTGLEYGYIASGEGLVLLRVPEDNPDTLYYFWRVFKPPTGNGVPAVRDPQHTAASYLTSLAMMGLQSTKRPQPWIDKYVPELRRWPIKPRPRKVEVQAIQYPIRPRDDDGSPGGPGGSGSGSGSGSGDGNDSGGGIGYNVGNGGGGADKQRSRNQSPRKRGRDSETDDSGHGPTAEHSQVQETNRLLPFCTQACLLGLARQLPLDPKCPNVHLHRAARRRLQGSAPLDDGHALNVQELRDVLAEQAKTDRAVNMRSLEPLGLYGRIGVLVRITAAGFGYTFVAKGVMMLYRKALVHELAIYDTLSACQGRLIPVCLGIVDLPENFYPGPYCTGLAQLLLLSFAGPDLTHLAALPRRVEIQEEMDRTERELRALGLYNDDIRVSNCAWNEEAQRVMHFDFDQAFFESSEPNTPDSRESLNLARTVEPSEPRTPNVEQFELSAPELSSRLELSGLSERPEPSEVKASPKQRSSQQAPGPQTTPLKQTQSPVLAKRDWNQFSDRNSPDNRTAHTNQRLKQQLFDSHEEEGPFAPP